MSFKRIDIKDIEGFKLGNAEDQSAGTGCTVIICEDGAVAAVDVRGGGPATRETDLLKSENTVQTINAVVLSGGSAFGLEAGSGVMKFLEEKKIGFQIGDLCVPIVSQASLYDLNVGDSSVRPDCEMGIEACRNAYEGIFDNGNYGAGTGATVGKLHGIDRAMKSGLGTFACSDGILEVGAVTAVNAFGDVYNGNNNIIAGLLNKEKDYIKGSISCLKNHVHGEAGPETPDIRNPFKLGRSVVDIQIDKNINGDLNSNLKSNSQDKYDGNGTEYSDEVNSSETLISETIKTQTNEHEVVETGESGILDSHEEIGIETEKSLTLHNCKSQDTAQSIAGELFENDGDRTSKSDFSEVCVSEPDTEYEPIPAGDMGYDIPFNTTISCLITNAKLTKTQANKLASILHDGYARAIKPVHGTLDGDAIFVMSTNRIEVNFDAFAALATDIMQYSVIDGALSATDAYGLKSSRTIIGK